MNKKLKLISGILLGTVISIGVMGCSKEDSIETNETISISGSTSVGPFMEKISEKYQEKEPNLSIEINQVGSSAGIKDVINGVAEIAMSSRNLKEEEKSQLDENIIAFDGIAIITNKSNIIKNITINQIKDIYTGKITNWKDIPGGEDAEIVVVSREEGSGTRTAFQEVIEYKSEELKSDAIVANGNGNIKSTVVGNKNAIGFVSFEYLDNETNVVNVEGVRPNAEEVKSGKYKISRPFIIVNKKDKLTDSSKKLIEYILSEEGQKLAEDNKLIRIK